MGVSALPRVFSGPTGATVQAYVGWAGLYQIAFLFKLGFAPFLVMMYRAGVFDEIETVSDAAELPLKV